MKHLWLSAIIIGSIVLAAGIYFVPSDFFQASVNVIKYYDEIGKVGSSPEAKVQVPKGDIFKDILPALIKLSVSVLVSVMLIYVTIAGIFFVSSGITEENYEAAKKIMSYMILGAIFITISLSLVYAITQIDWFQ